MGCNRNHEVYQINEQDGDMVFVTQLRCKNKYLDHNTYKNVYSKYVKYKINFRNSTYSCWEDKDTLYEVYEKFDKNKTYELWLWWLPHGRNFMFYTPKSKLFRNLKDPIVDH